MLVTFSTKAYADITMFGDVAVALLKMMGHSGTIPSAIIADDVATALQNLQSSLAVQAAKPQTDADEDEPKVSLSQRAMPLVELLTTASQQHTDVMWK